VNAPDAAARIEQARGLPDLFDLVKDVVRRRLGVERSGLMLGLSNLGGGPGYLLGGFYQVAGNMIVMNEFPLRRLQDTKPELYKPFAFHILLHEYIHAIGYLTESQTRPLVLEISQAEFGPDHPVTEFAKGWDKHLPNLVYPNVGYEPAGGFQLEVVRGIDPGATGYIQ
jgi:hypothetical protein